MSTTEKKLRVWKCCNGMCNAEFVVGQLKSSNECDDVRRCPFCEQHGTVRQIQSFMYVIEESKVSLPEVTRTGTVARRPMAEQESGVSSADAV